MGDPVAGLDGLEGLLSNLARSAANRAKAEEKGVTPWVAHLLDYYGFFFDWSSRTAAFRAIPEKTRPSAGPSARRSVRAYVVEMIGIVAERERLPLNIGAATIGLDVVPVGVKRAIFPFYGAVELKRTVRLLHLIDGNHFALGLSLIHISEPTRPH